MALTSEALEINPTPQAAAAPKAATFICSRDTLDGAYPALILGLNARRLGMDVTLFYTFMGVNLIRKNGLKKVKFRPPGTMGALPGVSSMATRMMKGKIDDAGIPNLDEMIEMAQLEGVRFVACKMTMDMMGLDEDDLLEGVGIQNAEEYLKLAGGAHINMFT